MDAGVLLARLVVGGLMAAHGSQKLFGSFGGYGLAGTGGFFEGLGFRPGRTFAALAGLAELGSGLLLAFGLLTPLAATLMVSVMIVAIATVHWPHGLLATSNGIELPLLYAAFASAIALTGPGAHSVDAVLGLTPYWTPAVTLGAIVLGVVGGLGNLALRRPSSEAHAGA